MSRALMTCSKITGVHVKKKLSFMFLFHLAMYTSLYDGFHGGFHGNLMLLTDHLAIAIGSGQFCRQNFGQNVSVPKQQAECGIFF